MTRILMVCLGNICRSPLAEGILSAKVDPALVFVDSAGTAGYHVGNPPDKRSIAVAKKNGIDISHQKCRKFVASDFKKFDHIYVMDRSNYMDVIAQATAPEDQAKVRLLMNEVNLDITEVPDPYYGGRDGFEYVFDLVDQACDAIAKNI
ncbi:MAG: low molecular weight protein-tyrosine-phosphatase [Bacteroidota bacterium]